MHHEKIQKEVKKTMKSSYSLVLILILMFSTFAVSFGSAQVFLDQKIIQEVEKATGIINDNQILRLRQNSSTQIGIGTVREVTSQFEMFYGYETIFTYAEISVSTPLTDNLSPEQTTTAKYIGGQVGDHGLDVQIRWARYPSDTIALPSSLKLSAGLNLMFFINATTKALVGYIPYTIAGSTTDLPQVRLLSETQPTTAVYESDDYGFRWDGGKYRLDWSDMPWQFQYDVDGTNDIDGAGTSREFSAIRAAFCTWGDAPCSGFTVADGGTYDYTTYGQYTADEDDGHNVIGWVNSGIEQGRLAETCRKYVSWYGYRHITDTDIAINDRDFTWTIGGNPDVQSCVTHEVGHAIGLEDLYEQSNSEQTMYQWLPGGTSQQTLEWGDLNGVHYLYPEHDDAGSGGDAGDSYIEAAYVNRNVWYYGRLCNLPGDLDNYDYFKFYATSGMDVFVRLYPPTNANFDLELRDPNNNLVAYSRNEGNGAEELIIRSPMGISGFWYVTIYTSETNRQESNGQYQFFISDYGARYVSSIYWAGWLSGLGYVLNANYETGSSPDGLYAGIYTLYSGDAATIMGRLNSPTYYPSDIYIYGYATGNPHVFVYVSQNANYDWYYVNDLFIQEGLSTTIYLGYTTQQFRYIAIALCNEGGGLGILFIDCVTVT
jgi:hypothetical protein